MKITAKFLTDNEACSEQVALFRKTFPKGAFINEANLLRANIAGLSLYWLIRHLRPGDRADTIPYDTVTRCAEYKAERKLETEQDTQLDRAWKIYEKQRDTAWRLMERNIRKLQRNRDLSYNEAKRLEKVERQKYADTRKQLGKVEKAVEKAVKRDFAVKLRKARKARLQREAEILTPYVMEAATIYRASQQSGE
jgi:hypothetical protein